MTPGELIAKKLDPGPYKRAHDRFAIEFNLSLQVLIPEETLTPKGLNGRALDVSARGMRVAIDAMPAEIYRKLIRHKRLGRIVFSHPATGDQLKLTGRIRWVDFHQTAAEGASGSCFMGLAFEEEETDLSNYEKFVRSLKVK